MRTFFEYDLPYQKADDAEKKHKGTLHLFLIDEVSDGSEQGMAHTFGLLAHTHSSGIEHHRLHALNLTYAYSGIARK